MKSTKVLILLFSQLLISLSLLGQDPTNGDEFVLNNQAVVPLSPNQAALFEYLETPVSYYKGTPDISIPIWTASEGAIQVPITLGYNAGGIRVEEEASYVGLKWALAMGGSISRTMIGKPDDSFKGYLDIGHEIPPNITQNVSGNPEASYQNIETLTKLADGDWDGNPDKFSFSFPGGGGKFAFDIDGKVSLIPFQKIKIEYELSPGTFASGARIDKWIITTADGTKYYFGNHSFNTTGATEDTDTESVCGGSGSTQVPYISTWFLTRIESPNKKDIIDFEYSQTYDHPADISTNEIKYFHLSTASGGCSNKNAVSCTSYSRVVGRVLTKIITETQTIEFNYSSGREDVKNYFGDDPNNSYPNAGIKLNTIQVKRTEDNQLIRQFQFTYDHYNAGATGVEAYLHKRLRLISLQESAPSELAKPPYTFSYNSNSLPKRTSKSQDHWGFFNDENPNATSLVPSYNDSQVQHNGAERSVNPLKVTQGMLQKITYPTGGHTTYEFQANEYGFTSRGQKRVVNTNWVNKSISVHDQYYDSVAQQTVASSGNYGSSFPFTVVQPFTINPHPTVSNWESWVHITNIETWNTQIANEWVDGFVGIREVGAGSSIDDMIVVFLTNQFSTGIRLPAGDYELFANISTNGEAVKMDILYENPADFTNLANIISYKDYAGGVRVSEIKTHDGKDASRDMIRKFYYNNPVESLSSSGVIGVEPQYLHLHTEYPPNPNHQYTSQASGDMWCYRHYDQACAYMALSSGSHNVLRHTQGNPIGYEYVTEERLNSQGESIGKTRYQYTTFRNYPDLSPNSKFASSFTDFDWRRGLLKSVKTFDEDGDPVTEKNNTYTFTADETMPGGVNMFNYGRPNNTMIQGTSARWVWKSQCSTVPYVCTQQDALDWTNYLGRLWKAEDAEGKKAVKRSLERLEILTSVGGPLGIAAELELKSFDNCNEVPSWYGNTPQKPGHFQNNADYYQNCIFIDYRACVGRAGETIYRTFHEFDYHQYYVLSEWTYLSETEEKMYDASGNIMSKTVKHFYDQPAHAQLTRTQSTNSDGQVVVSKLKYPEDYDETSSAGDANSNITIEDMVDKFLVGMPLEQQVWEGPDENNLELIKGKATSFADITTSVSPSTTSVENMIIQPQSVYLLETGGPIAPTNFTENTNTDNLYTDVIPDATYYKHRMNLFYDEQTGRLEKQQMTDGPAASYIWGYDHTLPIAEVIHAEPHEIAYTSFEEIIDNEGGWQFSLDEVVGAAQTGATYHKLGIVGSGEDLTKNGLDNQKDYEVGFWARTPTGQTSQVQINSGNTLTISDQWQYFVVEVSSASIINLTKSDPSGQNEVWIDEVRLYPKGASIKTYVYNETLQLWCVTGHDGRSSYYEYDGYHRLEYTKDHEGNYLQGIKYHFQGQ